MKLQKIAAAGAVAALLALAAAGRAEPAADSGSVSGKVTNAHGKPAAGAVVKLVSPNAAKPTAAEKKKKPTTGPSATADANGEYKIESVPAGQYTVTARDAEGGHAKTNITVTAGHDSSANLSLQAKRKP